MFKLGEFEWDSPPVPDQQYLKIKQIHKTKWVDYEDGEEEDCAYIGQCHKSTGKPNGLGRILYHDDLIEGYFLNGQLHGKYRIIDWDGNY